MRNFSNDVYDVCVNAIKDCEFCDFDIQYNPMDPNTVRVLLIDTRNGTYIPCELNSAKIDLYTNPLIYIDERVRAALNELYEMSQPKKPDYRDILIDQIKSVGRQLIDRAEEMVSKDLSYITEFSIAIDIPQPSDEPVRISWTTSTFETNVLKENE